MTTKVLVLDDSEEICFLIRLIAKKSGHDVLVQTDTNYFESSYLAHKPDIILLDLQMPDMDGIEVLRMLAKHNSTSMITIMSGMDGGVVSTATELGKAMGLDMASVLSKPLDMDLLRQILNMPPRSRVPVKNQKREILYDDLLQAIETNRILVHYQPKIDITTRDVTGVEALVRMLDTNNEIVFPDQIIPLAEETGLISQLTDKVIEISLKEIDIWHAGTQDKKTISINISPILLNDLKIPDRLAKVVLSNNSSPSQFILEITESAAIQDQVSIMDILSRLRLKGFELSIDDFGTGFATYKTLFQQPFCELKIDKSFVMKANKNEDATTIVKSIVELSQQLDINVVAEGIEDEDSLNWLASINCKSGQGYHICRPKPADQLRLWLEEYSNLSNAVA